MFWQNIFFILAAITCFISMYIGFRSKEEYNWFFTKENHIRLDFFYLYTFGMSSAILCGFYAVSYLFFPDESSIVGPIGILMRTAVLLFLWLLWHRPYNLNFNTIILAVAISTSIIFSIPAVGIDIYHDKLIARPWAMIPALLSVGFVVFLLYQLFKNKTNGITKTLCVSACCNLLSSLAIGFSGSAFDALHVVSMLFFMLIFVPLFSKFIYIKK